MALRGSSLKIGRRLLLRLGPHSPEVAWLHSKELFFQALRIYPKECRQIADELGLRIDLEDFSDQLEEWSPALGLTTMHREAPHLKLHLLPHLRLLDIVRAILSGLEPR